jgi:hypothetical protein
MFRDEGCLCLPLFSSGLMVLHVSLAPCRVHGQERFAQVLTYCESLIRIRGRATS